MLIRSKIHRPNAPITIEQSTYFFRPVDGTANGPHICEVSNEAHAQRFLSITEGYEAFAMPELARIAPVVPLTAPPAAPPLTEVPGAPLPPPPAGEHQDRVLALRGLNVADLRAQLQQITTENNGLALLAALLAAEEGATQPPPRRTVVDAIRARISALSA